MNMNMGEEVEEEWSASDDESADSPIVPECAINTYRNPTMGMGGASPSISWGESPVQQSPAAPPASMGVSVPVYENPVPTRPAMQAPPPPAPVRRPPAPPPIMTAQASTPTQPLGPSSLSNDAAVPLSRPSTASANNFKERMSRMQELQDRKRAERTGSSDLVSNGCCLPPTEGDTSNNVGVNMMVNTNATSKSDNPVSLTELNLQSQGMSMVFDPTANKPPTQSNSSLSGASASASSTSADSKAAALKKAKEEAQDEVAIIDTSSRELTKVFIERPFTSSGVVQCQITRHKSFMFNSFPTYELYLKDGMRFLMAARKRKKTKGAYYIISTSNSDISRHDQNFVGKVRSNLLGTNFSFSDSGVGPDDMEDAKSGSGEIRKEVGFLTYESNVLGAKGPRKMTCSLPKLTRDGSAAIFTGGSTGRGSIEAALSEDQPSGRREEVVQLKNRAPKWSERVAAYTLDFKGRVTMASVKNFQLVSNSDNDCVMLQFGKVGTDDFTMDFRAPLSPLQAFSICLSSLDNKWACE